MGKNGNAGVKPKLLIVDDDKKLCRLVADYLTQMAYDVDTANNGVQALEMCRNKSYSAIILDVMMPGMDGFEVLRCLRREHDVPVLMLTARGEETDRIVGLEMGADDYVPKTFSSRELLARLRAVIRRSAGRSVSRSGPVEKQKDHLSGAAGQCALVVDTLRINESARRVTLDDAVVNLTPLEYDLLITLARSAGRVLSREYILSAIAERQYEVFDRSVDVHISSLRRKLREDPRSPKFIQTVRGAGYLFKVPGEGT